MSQLQLSVQAYHRDLKLTRTIADLAASERIAVNHLEKALHYRPRNVEEKPGWRLVWSVARPKPAIPRPHSRLHNPSLTGAPGLGGGS